MKQLKTDEERKRTQLQLPKSLYRELEERAAERKQSMNLVITELLTAALAGKGIEMEKDWALDTIEQMKAQPEVFSYDAAASFIRCFSDGDSIKAWSAYRKLASEWIEVGQGESLILFHDGSCCASWKDPDTDRFYPDIYDLRADDEDIDTLLRKHYREDQ
jgi:plasmid stability protein